ncbi:MAG: LacI family DNA-binding transcriptional regulator, partial [Gaiellaceae bacterium]
RLRNRLNSARQTPGRDATLADVAEYAGVSSSTASRALNGRGEFSAQTRAAVLEAAEALKFQPSVLARSLRTRTTFTVGFVVPDVASPFYAAALKGAQGALEESGYRVMLMNSGQEVAGEVAALKTLLNHQVDGLLLSTTGISARRFEDTVGRRGTPCVFFDSMLDGAGAGGVRIDNARGIDLLVDHLVEHGHRQIALLAGSLEETSGRERLDAYYLAMERNEIAVGPERVRVCRWSQDAGRAATHSLLDLDNAPSAIVASSAELAVGCLVACRERHLQLPEELAVVSFDDPYFGVLLEPALTAVSYDAGEVGSVAATLLVEAMRDGEIRRELSVPVNLVRRRSCGCEDA